MTEQDDRSKQSEPRQQQSGGMPGDGVGRREEPGRTGVHPASAGWPEKDMEIRREGEWGQGDRGLEGYEDAGESELSPLPEDAHEQRAGVGRPGPPDEANSAIETGGSSVAGRPGPADETTSLGTATGGSSAGEPGPSDEANAALGVPLEGTPREPRT